MDVAKVYKEKLRPRLEALTLTGDEIDVVLDVVSAVNGEMIEILEKERPQIKRAVGVNCEVSWVTGDSEDPVSAVVHLQGFESLQQAMEKYAELKKDPLVWDVVVKQCLAAESKILAYYMLKPRMETRNLVVDAAEEPV